MQRDLINHIGIIAALAAVAVMPILFQGIPGGNDLSQHLLSAQAVRESLLSGDLFPGFAAGINHGFGDIGLRFYPPFSYYAVNLFYAVSNNWFAAFLCSYFLTFFAGGLGVYLWAERVFGRYVGLAAAALYTFAPYHLNEIYNNALFAEFTASAILPFCFLFAERISRNSSAANVIGLASAVALLILTNLPIAIIGLITLTLYIVVLLRHSAARRLPGYVLSALLAVGLSAFYWLRLLTEMSWVKHSDNKYFSGIWSYRSNYLLDPATILHYSSDDLALWLGNAMLAVSIIASLATAVLLIRRKLGPAKSLYFIGGAFLFCVLMATPLTAIVWDNFPILQKVQFPWRWMIMVSLFGSVFAAVGLIHLARPEKSIFAGAAGVGLPVLLLVFVSAFVARSPSFIPHGEFGNTDTATAASTESYEAWWPAWASRRAFSQSRQVIAGERPAAVTLWSPLDRQFTVDPGEPADASVATFFYPHWKATVNGTAAEVSPNADGLIQVRIPAERSEVVLRFEEPWFLVLAGWISLICWVGCLVIAAGSRFRPRATLQMDI